MALPIVQSTDNPCGLCVVHYGRSCCSTSPRSRTAARTYGELKRIADYCDLSIWDVADVVRAEDALTDVESAPDVSLAVRGVALVLKLVPDGYDKRSCKFLNEAGCSIPEVKPWLCRMFPFHIEDDVIRSPVDGDCYGVDRADTMTELLDAFQMTSAEIFALRDLWFADLKTHYEDVVKEILPWIPNKS